MRALLIGKACITSIILIPSLLLAYTPPKGIPNPSAYFSSFGEIDQATPSTAKKCPDWPKAASRNCYYVDNTHPASTDNGNPNGYPKKPRATIPSLSGLSAGTFIYVHAGTYTGRWWVTGVGTASNPIWVTGNPETKPVIQRPFLVGYNGRASYIVIENFTINNGYNFASIRNASLNANIDHILIRNNTAYGSGTSGDPSDSASTVGNSSSSAHTVSYIVFYKNIFHDYNDRKTRDGGGIYFDQNVNYGWVLDNTIYNISGDGIAGCHRCNIDGNQPHNIFLGRNTLYGHGENCIDFKGVHDFVISENICYGPFVREQGWGIVIHDSEATPHTDPTNGWIIFNKLYHLSSGIAYVSCNSRDMYVVGNLIYDIHASYAAHADPSYNGRAVLGASNAGNFWIVDNTIHDYDEGIKICSKLSGTDSVRIHGNIFSSRSDGEKHELNLPGRMSTSFVTIDYNTIYSTSGSMSFNWGGSLSSVRGLKAMGKCVHCKEADPLFRGLTDFRLRPGSLCVDSSVRHSVYDVFYSKYGMNMDRDFADRQRPQGSAWDMGAYEY